jgi:hypothetical protein
MVATSYDTAWDLPPTGVHRREPQVPTGLARDLDILLQAWSRSKSETGLAPLLPLLFTLKGKPYEITSGHFPMAPMFKLNRPPRKTLWKTGRQVSKSTTQAFQGSAFSIVLPNFNTGFITPLYEQVRRFSTNYVRPAVNSCILRDYIREKFYRGQESVLQRSFPHNNSSMFFSFAFQDAERVRGLSLDKVVLDEVQGINREFLPVIEATMDASPWRIQQYTGTPLSLANTMEHLWQQSSQAEWAIKCGCGYTNVLGYFGGAGDLLKCLGQDGLICAKPGCGKPLNTEQGYWLHSRKERRNSFAGYHAPQCIFPMHCRSSTKWLELLGKRDRNFPSFMMECMGESWDVGTKLVSQKDLQTASVLPWRNTWEDYIKNYNKRGYQLRVLSIDWSGGGSDEVSLTAMSALGLRIDGKVEVGWMKHYPHTTDWMEDAARVKTAFEKGAFDFVVHDFGGAGAGREQILLAAGFPFNRLIPVTYVHTTGAKALMTFNKPQENNVRSSYSLDKTRSLITTCELIKQGWMLFPQYESCNDNLEDFLALTEDTLQTPRGSDIHLIGKVDGIPDDMAHSINIGACALFYRVQKWPDLGQVIRKYDAMVLGELNPDKGAARILAGVE